MINWSHYFLYEVGNSEMADIKWEIVYKILYKADAVKVYIRKKMKIISDNQQA